MSQPINLDDLCPDPVEIILNGTNYTLTGDLPASMAIRALKAQQANGEEGFNDLTAAIAWMFAHDYGAEWTSEKVQELFTLPQIVGLATLFLGRALAPKLPSQGPSTTTTPEPDPSPTPVAP